MDQHICARNVSKNSWFKKPIKGSLLIWFFWKTNRGINKCFDPWSKAETPTSVFNVGLCRKSLLEQYCKFGHWRMFFEKKENLDKGTLSVFNQSKFGLGKFPNSASVQRKLSENGEDLKQNGNRIQCGFQKMPK